MLNILVSYFQFRVQNQNTFHSSSSKRRYWRAFAMFDYFPLYIYKFVGVVDFIEIVNERPLPV